MSGNAMDTGHASFTIRSGPGGTFTGDCGCGASYGDYRNASELLEAMDLHWIEVGA